MGEPSSISDRARDELVRDAVRVRIERDRLARQVQELQRLLDGPESVGGPHDVMLWQIWHDRALAAEVSLDRCGSALAHADRAIRALVDGVPSAARAVASYRQARAGFDRLAS